MPDEKQSIERRPTGSAEAYDLCLMARQARLAGHYCDLHREEKVVRLERSASEASSEVPTDFPTRQGPFDLVQETSQVIGLYGRNGLRIAGARPLQGAVCQSYGDHRVAMTMAIAGLVAQGETRVEDVACISTSFPDFDKYLRRLLTASG